MCRKWISFFENLNKYSLIANLVIIILHFQTENRKFDFNSQKMKPIRFAGILFSLLIFSGLNAQEVTDYDLTNFAKAYLKMVKLNTSAQNEMSKLIEKEGMDLEIYHAINDSKEADYEPDVDEEYFEKYERLQPKLQKIQNQLEADVEKEFAKNDLTKQKYRAISERVKQDYLLQAKLEKLLEHLR
jgi:hypothetical protein